MRANHHFYLKVLLIAFLLCIFLLELKHQLLLPASYRPSSGGTINCQIRPLDEYKFAHLPIYYINLPKYHDRDISMKARLSQASYLRRISAIDGTNITDLLEYFDPGKNDTSEFQANPPQYLYDKRTCVPGQLGNYLSHLLAIREAYEEGKDHVIIMEDDYSEVCTGIWPIDNINNLIEQADQKYPNWHAIRLQWHDYPGVINKLHEDWLKKIGGDDERISLPLLTKHYGGWGNMATLWSREGLSVFLGRYASVEDPGKFICLEGRPCSADLSFWTHDQILITTPPLLGPNVLGKSTEEIRKGVWDADHSENHRKAAAAQFLWLAEAYEISSSTINITKSQIIIY